MHLPPRDGEGTCRLPRAYPARSGHPRLLRGARPSESPKRSSARIGPQHRRSRLQPGPVRQSRTRGATSRAQGSATRVQSGRSAPLGRRSEPQSSPGTAASRSAGRRNRRRRRHDHRQRRPPWRDSEYRGCQSGGIAPAETAATQAGEGAVDRDEQEAEGQGRAERKQATHVGQQVQVPADDRGEGQAGETSLGR